VLASRPPGESGLAVGKERGGAFPAGQLSKRRARGFLFPVRQEKGGRAGVSAALAVRFSHVRVLFFQPLGFLQAKLGVEDVAGG